MVRWEMKVENADLVYALARAACTSNSQRPRVRRKAANQEDAAFQGNLKLFPPQASGSSPDKLLVRLFHISESK